MTRTSLLLLLAVFFAPGATLAGETYGNATCARVVRVYDGDIFYCDIEGWPAIVGSRIGIRVAGVDTPEMRGKTEREKALAIEAKGFVVSWLKDCPQVELRDLKRRKYFRIVADVYCGEESLSDALIRTGLARPYDGGTKIPW